ncbi:MAG: ATP synthase F1 subunit gamma [Candidatus Desulfofervidaceae bacterium]|nr:ATP synthase F1 subunit gamma [Candidatus Desulfofervidaceae bacterium]MDL1970871.1 ATP synthase F1 subunit gamma [Candidatus Desulfofervidaceae bacterium]
MPGLRDIKRKIVAVKKTQQITRAMNMVAAAKLRSVQARMEGFRVYADKYKELISHLSMVGGVSGDSFPLLQKREEIKKIHLVVLTADRGLCGAFNTNLINKTEKFIAEAKEKGQEVSLTVLGRRGVSYFKRYRADLVKNTYEDIVGKFDYAFVSRMARELVTSFLTGEADEVALLYAHFGSVLRQIPTVEPLLPIVPQGVSEEASKVEYIYEPKATEILREILPKSINIQLYSRLLENEVSEHAARMTAMDNATNNCKEMITQLTLIFNKARQASITKELMDIVGGAEALKG